MDATTKPIIEPDMEPRTTFMGINHLKYRIRSSYKNNRNPITILQI
jgi:hypothetical protein